jgi:phosphonate metabolism protein (transferase hexapeptide repeat family)
VAHADLGRFVNVASFVRIGPTDHPMWRVTQHHFTYRSAKYGFGPDDAEIFDWRRERRCEIGCDAWLGHAAIVMPGVRVGHGVVVGSGAVVTRDVDDYAVVAGVPARVVRARFPEDVARRLVALAWWDWPHERIGAALEDFRSLAVEAFLERYENGAGA